MRLFELALSAFVEQLGEVGVDTCHDAFGLGIAHTDVVFDDVRVAAAVHQAQEDKAFIVDLLFFQARNRRFYDAFFDFPDELRCDERHR